MTKVSFALNPEKLEVSLHVKGHAGQNVVGSDIVCASISILAYTLAQNMLIARERGLTKYDPKIKLKSGDAIITVRGKDEESYAALCHDYCVVQAGYQVLAHNYPRFVALEMFGQDEAPIQ